jgi:dihydrodipicolinate synthase/N-acetylneuraminate lyase
MATFPQPPGWVIQQLREGQVIPAHPLALTAGRTLDERRQRALTRYYHTARAGGIAVAVHTTQFAIRDAAHNLLKPVLELARDTLKSCDTKSARQTIAIAGICGRTEQAVREAELARTIGYHIGLLSLAALRDATEDELLEHCRNVAEEIPIMGFYLQPAVGGRLLEYSFWRRFVEIPNVVGIKIAPFNRYQTLEVIRAVAESGQAARVALYTGNDDNIVNDLLTEFRVRTAGGETPLQMMGGLLGQWACGTQRAVELLQQCKRSRASETIPTRLLRLGAELTDFNAAIFDAAHAFAGCIAGIHEVLRRQGLLAGTWCLDAAEKLSPGQVEEIERVYQSYPHLNDDEFVAQHRDEWLAQ